MSLLSKASRRHWEDNVDMNAAVPPFDYNPSAWSQRIPIAILATVGGVIAAYMGLYQWHLIPSIWDPIFGAGSERVVTSDVAHRIDRWLHIPDSVFGSIGYFSEALFSMAGSTRRWQFRPWLVLLFGFDVIPLGGVSAILVIAQGFIVGEWCFLCLVTAVISFILIYFAVDEVYVCLRYLWRVWKRSRSGRVLWDTFLGRASDLADEVALERS